MFANMDSSSLLFLLIGKNDTLMPYILIIILLINNIGKIRDAFKNIPFFQKTQYELNTKYIYNKREAYYYHDIPVSIWAVLYSLNNIIKKKDIVLSKARNIELPQDTMFGTDELCHMPDDNSKISINDNLWCYIDIEKKNGKYTNAYNKRQESTTEDIDEITLTIRIVTNKTVDTILSYINDVTAEYNKIKKDKIYDTLYIVKPQFVREKSHKMDYPKRIPFNTNKTFDNLFFDGKDELLSRLNMFKNCDKYKSLGLPETLGLLFYGEPGTGKTSAIKAIANYLRMNIVIVPMANIKKKKQLEDIFFDMPDIPMNKRIYVFEEIDCNGWENIVRDRRFIVDQKNDKKHEADSTNAIEIIADKLKSDSKKKDDDDDDKLTLGAILEIIDGLVETPGRIIIMTTNHKGFLDPALLRPGRIDMEIEFKKLRRCHIAQIYQKWYGMPMNLYVLNEIPDYKFTQAEISQMLFKHEKSPDDFIREITKLHL